MPFSVFFFSPPRRAFSREIFNQPSRVSTGNLLLLFTVSTSFKFLSQTMPPRLSDRSNSPSMKRRSTRRGGTMARQDLGTEGEASSAVRSKHGKAASNPQRVPSGDLQHNTIVIPSTGGRQSRSCARRSQPNSHRVCAEEQERISEQVIGSSLVPNDDGNNMNIDNERIPEQGAVADTPTQSTRKPPRSSRRKNLPSWSQSEGSQVPSASVNHTRRSNVAKPSNESVPSRSTTLPSTRARTALKPPRPPRLSQRISTCLLYTSPSPRDQRGSRMPSSA